MCEPTSAEPDAMSGEPSESPDVVTPGPSERHPSTDSALQASRQSDGPTIFALGQKRMAIGAVVVFALGVVITVGANWPSPCDRAARRICEAAWARDCSTLVTLIDAHADAQLCSEQLVVLQRIDDDASKRPRSYHYLGVIRRLIGDEAYLRSEATAAP